MAEQWRVSALRWVGLTLLFGCGAIGSTWPLALEIDQSIALGTEAVATVPIFNLWSLAWNVESLDRNYDDYWQAPIFFPSQDAFALSEPQPLTGILAAAVVALGGSPLLAYNLLLLGALALNGLLATALFRQTGMGWLPAISGGALVLLLPFSHQELGVFHLVPLAGVLLFAMAALQFARRPKLRSGAGLGVSLAVAYGLSAQIAAFTAMAAVPVVLWWWWPHRRSKQAWAGVALGAVLFLALCLPLIVAQKGATADLGFSRSVETVRKQSARPAQYLASPWPTLVPVPGIDIAERPSQRAFWPGAVRVALALAALALAWSRPRWRRPAIAGGLLLLASLLWSFGANLGLGEHSLLEALRWVPGLAQIRSFFRFALLAQLAVAALAAGALQLLLERAETKGLRWGRLWVGSLALVAVLEMRPAMGPIETLPPLDLELPWLSWIERETTEQDVLAFVPFPEGRSSQDYLGTSQWMYWQMRHWRPMVNGYSGFFPSSFRALKKEMEAFPGPEALRALYDANVRYCIVHRRVISNSPPPDPEAPIRLIPRFRDEQHELAIFELRG